MASHALRAILTCGRETKSDVALHRDLYVYPRVACYIEMAAVNIAPRSCTVDRERFETINGVLIRVLKYPPFDGWMDGDWGARVHDEQILGRFLFPAINDNLPVPPWEEEASSANSISARSSER